VGVLGSYLGSFYLLIKIFDEELKTLNKGGISQEMVNNS